MRMKKLVTGGAIAAVGVLAMAAPALAQDAEGGAAGVVVDLNSVFVFLCGVLVFFMGMGFAFVETGLTRSRSAAHMMMKNLITAAIGVLAYWAIGFAIGFGDGNDLFGWSGFFMTGTYEDAYTSLSGYAGTDLFAMWFFQAAFAATAATIISGAMAERTKLTGYIAIAVLVSGVIYPVVVHWQWGGGWLAQLGFLDYAGSAIVHMTGGVAALIGVILLGPRIGRYDASGRLRVIPGHSIPFAVLGTFVLWVGWFGFNVGSWLGAEGAADWTEAIAVTALGGAAGALAAMTVTWIMAKKPDVSMTANGALAGLVSVTAGAGFVDDWAGVIIALVGGVLVVFAVQFFDKVRIDDPVGAISVHGVCGMWGTLAVGLFAAEDKAGRDGLLLGGGAGQLGDQIVGVVAIAAFVAVASLVLFSVVKAVFGLRVTPEEELQGLDMAEHGMLGYGADVYVSEGAAV